MKPGLQVGIARELKFTVTEDMCPAFDGEIIHRCYSTWSVAHHMEVASRAVLKGFLEADEEAVGAHLSVEHHAPCGIGKVVRHRAELVELRHRIVTCAIEVLDGERMLARGKQVQVVKPKAFIERMIREAT